jgi:hypothetical protein
MMTLEDWKAQAERSEELLARITETARKRAERITALENAIEYATAGKPQTTEVAILRAALQSGGADG